MKLITKAIENKLKKTPFNSTNKVPFDEKKCIVKFFTPWSNWTWYVVEGELLPDGDWLFFGLVEGFEAEWGDFRLSDLQSLRGPAGLRVERDMYFGDAEWQRTLERLGY